MPSSNRDLILKLLSASPRGLPMNHISLTLNIGIDAVGFALRGLRREELVESIFASRNSVWATVDHAPKIRAAMQAERDAELRRLAEARLRSANPKSGPPLAPNPRCRWRPAGTYRPLPVTGPISVFHIPSFWASSSGGNAFLPGTPAAPMTA